MKGGEGRRTGLDELWIDEINANDYSKVCLQN